MKPAWLIIMLFCFTVACIQSASNKTNQPADTTLPKVQDKTPLTKEDSEEKKRISFTHITEITADSSASVWVKKQDSSFSLALHFRYKDTLVISYSLECYLMYPYKLDADKIIVYWDNNIDTKYDFDIVKAVNSVPAKNTGKPFMVLELINDSTLKAIYPDKELIRKINKVNKKRRFFPDTFTIVQEDEMYD